MLIKAYLFATGNPTPNQKWNISRRSVACSLPIHDQFGPFVTVCYHDLLVLSLLTILLLAVPEVLLTNIVLFGNLKKECRKEVVLRFE